MRSAAIFFLLTCSLSWSCWFAAIALHPADESMQLVFEALMLLGTFMPALVAVALAGRSDGTGAIAAIFTSILRARVGIRWYVFAILYMPVIKALVALTHVLLTGKLPRFGHEGPLIIAVAIVLSTPVQAGEEIGWRGFALPRLAEQIGLRWAGVVVGLVWGVWHLPFFFLPGADKYHQSMMLYVSGVVAASVALTWLYAKTRGSLLLVMLMHSAFNQMIGIVPDGLRPGEAPFAFGASLPLLLTVGWMWMVAAVLLWRMPEFTAALRVGERHAQAAATL